jgi:phage-related protein
MVPSARAGLTGTCRSASGMGGRRATGDFCSRSEPVRDWLKGLSAEERREIGQDIATVEYGWPVGMPVCRPLGQGLWEVRSTLPGNRIARVIFCIAQGRMALLHRFVKKTQKIPNDDLALARRRMKEIEQ